MVGMVERGGGWRLALKLMSRRRLFRYFLGKKFESNRTGEFQILSPVHHSHSSPTQGFQNAIAGNAFAGKSTTPICWKGRRGLRIFFLCDVRWGLPPFDGHDEPISSARQRLSVFGMLGIILYRLP